MSKARTSDDLPPFIQLPTYNPHIASPRPSRSQSLLSEFIPIDWHALPNYVRRKKARDLMSLPIFLVLLWILVLHWGERGSLRSHLAKCSWDRWEDWPSRARPYHLALISDPQLVDPHTYPGRRWPASRLTEIYTDQYMRRAFWRIQTDLHVDGAILLGDLFDGGREWATNDHAHDGEWGRYGQSFWLHEYRRFGRIFTDQWLNFGQRDVDRVFMAGLPGNHDLGFGNGIRPDVRTRFQTYFGPGDRVDVIANHTFISLDSVSLSAKCQMDDRQEISTEIWEPTDQFLHQLPSLRRSAIDDDLLDPAAVDLNDTRAQTMDALKFYLRNESASTLPSIILSHVPFFREPHTDCGRLREGPGMAIDISYGHQYQNVLTAEISDQIVDLVGGDIRHIFSGDDHDYCEIEHEKSKIREITVKAFSWAMGVRRPGFLLVSLWNPLDEPQETSIQTHLCLLPDQLGIFVRYAEILALTLLLLIIEAWGGPCFVKLRGKPHARTSPTLPMTRSRPRSHSEAYPYSGKINRWRRFRNHVMAVGSTVFVWYLWTIWIF